MDTLKFVLDLAHTGGAALAPVFIVLWWLERTDRKAAESKNDVMAEKIVIAMTETKAALSSLGMVFGAHKK